MIDYKRIQIEQGRMPGKTARDAAQLLSAKNGLIERRARRALDEGVSLDRMLRVVPVDRPVELSDDSFQFDPRRPVPMRTMREQLLIDGIAVHEVYTLIRPGTPAPSFEVCEDDSPPQELRQPPSAKASDPPSRS